MRKNAKRRLSVNFAVRKKEIHVGESRLTVLQPRPRHLFQRIVHQPLSSAEIIIFQAPFNFRASREPRTPQQTA
jgi:hypothetical protein